MKTEPLWWSDARVLRERGWSYPRIGEHLGRNHTSVAYALKSQEFRDRRCAATRARYRLKVWNVNTQRNGKERYQRGKLILAAWDESVRRGLHVDLVLIAWGQPARREMMSRRHA